LRLTHFWKRNHRNCQKKRSVQGIGEKGGSVWSFVVAVIAEEKALARCFGCQGRVLSHVVKNTFFASKYWEKNQKPRGKEWSLSLWKEGRRKSYEISVETGREEQRITRKFEEPRPEKKKCEKKNGTPRSKDTTRGSRAQESTRGGALRKSREECAQMTTGS